MMKSLGMVRVGAAAIAFLVPRLHVPLPEGVQSTFEGRRFRLESARRRRIFREWLQSSNAIAVLSTNALKQSSWYRTPVTHPVKSAGLR
jgi:hypothetical protein